MPTTTSTPGLFKFTVQECIDNQDGTYTIESPSGIRMSVIQDGVLLPTTTQFVESNGVESRQTVFSPDAGKLDRLELALHIPDIGADGFNMKEGVEGMINMPFATKNSVTSVGAGEMRQYPQTTIESVPLPQDRSILHVACAGILCNEAGTHYFPVNSPDRQRIAVVLHVAEASQFDIHAFAAPRIIQLEMVNGGSVFLMNTYNVDTSPEHAYPYDPDEQPPEIRETSLSPSAILDGTEWRLMHEYRGLALWCASPQDNQEGILYYADIDLSGNVGPMTLAGNRLFSFRIRYSTGKADDGFDLWRQWTPYFGFSLNTPPPPPSGLSLTVS